MMIVPDLLNWLANRVVDNWESWMELIRDIEALAVVLGGKGVGGREYSCDK